MKELILKQNPLTLLSRAARWHYQYYIKRIGYPITAGIYITNFCNIKCEMCNYWKEKNINRLSLDKLKDIVKDLKDLGCYYISFAGGEPFTHNDMIKMLAYSKKHIPYVHVVTNGTLINKEKTIELAETKINEISISLDGTEEFHDHWRGVKGTYAKAISAIKLLQIHAPKIDIVINTVITPFNFIEIYALVEVCQKLNVKQKFQPLNNTFLFGELNGEKYQGYLEKKRATYKQAEELVTFLLKQKHVINSRFFLRQIPEYFQKGSVEGSFGNTCLNPHFTVEIKEDGTVFPCLLGMDWKGGFPINGGLKQLIRSQEYARKQKELESCQKCKSNMQVCYWESRAVFPMNNFLKYSK